MEIRVFDISDNIKEEKIGDIAIENIEKIFNKIFSTKNTDHLMIECYANNNSIVKRYSGDKNFDLRIFSDELHEAEKKLDGSKNKQITSGYLFIKRDGNKLMLLKLENIEVIDKERNYEMKSSFSTEANYYKGCLFEGKLDKITIIDKNKSIAKYWRERFLDLSLKNDEYQNSNKLISLIKNIKLFSNEINSQKNFNEINSRVENYIFENSSFDKKIFADLLRSEGLIDQIDLNLIYSEESKGIDSEFLLSKKAIREKYNKTISVSTFTKIHTDNFSKLIMREGIKYEDGTIILTVDENFIDRLPEELKDGN